MGRDADCLHTVIICVPLDLRGQAMSAIEFMEPEPAGVGLFQCDEAGEQWEVGAYFDRDPSGYTLSMILAAFGTDNVAIRTMTRLEWSRKVQQHMQPVRSGRFTVHGPFDAGNTPPSSTRICMDSVLAFGVGHHATTRGMLEAMSALWRQGCRPRRVLDLGVGTGALSIGAARLWRARCIATDIDPSAIAAVTQNARASRARPLIRALRTGRATGPAITANAPYDLVMANIRPEPLRGMAPQIARLAGPGSRILLSGMREVERPPVEHVFAGWGMRVRKRWRINEWRVLLLDRTSQRAEAG